MLRTLAAGTDKKRGEDGEEAALAASGGLLLQPAVGVFLGDQGLVDRSRGGGLQLLGHHRMIGHDFRAYDDVDLVEARVEENVAETAGRARGDRARLETE